jgi:uncharacterized protein (TIGR04255 family)
LTLSTQDIEFSNPPLVEVVLGVQFDDLPISSVHIGQLWDLYKTSFPAPRDVPPLAPSIETFQQSSLNEQPGLILSNGTLLPRVWFLNDDQSELIQIQQDRFLRNWKLTHSSIDYPRFPKLKERFRHDVTLFTNFLESNSIPPVAVNQCELTYVNQIRFAKGTVYNDGLASSLNFFANLTSLPSFCEPETIEFVNRYKIIDSSKSLRGRLYVSGQPMLPPDPVGLRLTFTARGAPTESSLQSAINLLDHFHEVVVSAFTSLTTTEMHNKWGRTHVTS